MKIIFNEAKALENKFLYEKKLRNYWRVIYICSAVGVFGISLLITAALTGFFIAWLFWVGVFLMIFSLPIAAAYATDADFKPQPPADVIYYLSSQEKTVLDVKVEPYFDGWLEKKAVYLVTEDREGRVENLPLFVASYQENTTLSEPFINLNESIICIPYSPN